MPKISKVVKISSDYSTKPGDPPPEKVRPDKYICTRCGKVYIRQKSNFPASQSPLYKDSGYLSVCYRCMDNLYDHYKEALGGGAAAMERICMKFDIYWNPELYGMINKINSSASRVKSYISKTFLIRYLGKTYDDTLDEERLREIEEQATIVEPEPVKEVPGPVEQKVEETADAVEEVPEEPVEIPAELIQFWGSGFDLDTYNELDQRFERWTKDLPKPLPIVVEALYRQICIQEIMINRNIACGKDVEKGQNALNSLLSSLNVKPNQKQRDDDNSELESTPLGVWAKRWEEKRPIPEYEDEISGPKLIKYITTWFYGHIAKSLGLKNMYSKVYEDEIAKYRVEKPEFEDDDDDQIIEEITLGGDGQ